MRGKIFISYRRDDTRYMALNIAQFLGRTFGDDKVFFDIDIPAGEKFPTAIEKELAKCTVLLALIGPQWLDVRDQNGRRRLDDPKDWVRLEIAHAFRRGIVVIPVTLAGATLPERTSLPDDIQGLLDHQAAAVEWGSFKSDMAGLAHDIKNTLPGSTPVRKFAIVATLLALAGVLSFALIELWNQAPLLKGSDHTPTKSVLVSPKSSERKPAIETVKLTISEFTVGSHDLPSGAVSMAANDFARATFSIENRANVDVGIAVQESGYAIGPCIPQSAPALMFRGMPSAGVFGLAAVHPSQIDALRREGRAAEKLSRLPAGAKINGVIVFWPGDCRASMFSKLDKVSATINVVLATTSEVVVLPLNAESVPIRVMERELRLQRHN